MKSFLERILHVQSIIIQRSAKGPDISFESLYHKYRRFKENRGRATTLETQCWAIELHILTFFRDVIVSAIKTANVAE